ncbi:MAG: hypothetical protein ACPLPT_03540 [Moorellales bacterium]
MTQQFSAALPAAPDRETYEQIYRLLDEVTPLAEDCGKLCGKLCCQPDRPDTGIYLFPGEEAMFRKDETWLTWTSQQAEEYDFPPSWRGTVYFVRCRGICPRHSRPLQCRFFPLTAHYLPDGHLAIIWETLSLPYCCPLLTGAYPLRQDFVLAVAEAWRRLVGFSLVRDLVRWDSRQRGKAAKKLVFWKHPVTGQTSVAGKIVKIVGRV